MMFFDELVAFRLRKTDVKDVKKIVRKDFEKYDSESHFYRAAVLKEIRNEKLRLRL
jgi:hypothetical protein